jgi:hypothetical protein
MAMVVAQISWSLHGAFVVPRIDISQMVLGGGPEQEYAASE